MRTLLRVLTVAGAERPALIASMRWRMLEALFSAVPLILLFLAMRSLLDASPGDAAWLHAALPMLLLLVGAYAAQGFCANRGAAIGYSAGYRMTAGLRQRLVTHMAALPAAELQRHESGNLSAVLLQDVTAVETVPTMLIQRLVAASVLPPLAIGIALLIDPLAGGMLGIALLVALAMLALSQRMMRRVSARRAAATASLNARLLEFVQGLGVVRAFGLAEGRLARLEGALEESRRSGRAITWRFVVPAVAAPIALALGAAALLWTMAEGLAAGRIGAAELLLLAMLSLRLFAPLSETVEFSALLRQLEAALDRIHAVLDIPLRPAPPMPLEPEGSTLRFTDVRFRYGEAPTLGPVSFTVPQGQMTALAGPTGAGKTTIARLAAGEWEAEAGRITIGGTDVAALPPARIASLVGVVTQGVTLFSLSLRDNMLLARPGASDAEIHDALDAACCTDIVARLPQGLDSMLVNGGAALSGGERQRLAIARLFLKNSPLIILDEATSALDVENERLVQQAVGRLLAGRTVLVIAHRLWTVRHAAQILMLGDGLVRESGRHEDLLAAGGAYAALWQALQEMPGWRRIAPDAPPPLLPGAAA